jgi:chaperonin GroES
VACPKTPPAFISVGRKMGVSVGSKMIADSHNEERYMKFRPLHDRIVIKRIEAEAKSAGGILIPDTVKEKPSQGEVVAVGPGGRDESGKLIPIDLKAGDRVLFGKWSGTEVKIDDNEYLIMKESDVMGVLVETEARKKAA